MIQNEPQAVYENECDRKNDCTCMHQERLTGKGKCVEKERDERNEEKVGVKEKRQEQHICITYIQHTYIHVK